MIMTRYLGAAGVAVFMMGVAAGYALSGSAKADAYKMTAMAPQAVHGLNDQASQQAMIVAVDVMAPGAYWAPLTGDGSN